MIRLNSSKGKENRIKAAHLFLNMQDPLIGIRIMLRRPIMIFLLVAKLITEITKKELKIAIAMPK